LNIVSYTLHIAVVSYQTAVLRGDIEEASKILPKVPNEQRNKIAQFLDAQGYKEQALEVSLDPDHRFDLAIHVTPFSLFSLFFASFKEIMNVSLCCS
jgi:coatomer subunit beta'